MALALSFTGTVAPLPVAPFDMSDQGQTTVENSIPRGAYDARAGVATGLYGYEELNQFIAIMAQAYAEAPLSIIAHFHKMLATMLADRNTGEG